MKLTIVFLSVLGALASGCTAPCGGVVLAPVEPSAGRVAGAGSLVVYSAFDVNPSFNSRDSERQHYSDYKILTEDGRLLRVVHNDSGTLMQDPLQVALPAGHYRVLADANGCGLVTVPVVIADGKLTTVRLDHGFAMAR
jgi:hypothetical protein